MPVIARASPAITRGSSGTPAGVQRVGHPVGEQRMDAGPAEQDLRRPHVARRRIAALGGADVGADLGRGAADEAKARHQSR